MEVEYDRALEALRVLVEQYPGVKEVVAVDGLLQLPKNHNLQTYERKQLIAVLAELIVHAEYALPVVRHFRPLLLHVVNVVIANSLENGFSRGSFRRTCAAFSLMLPVAPCILPHILKYFKRSPSLFDAVIESPTRDGGDSELEEVARIGFEFARFSVDTFGKLWDWSPLLRLLHSENSNTRWYSSHCIALFLRLSDSNAQKFFKSIMGAWPVLPPQTILDADHERHLTDIYPYLEFTNIPVLNDAKALAVRDFEFGSIQQSDIDSDLVCVCGVLLPRRKTKENKNWAQHKFVVTETSAQNLHTLALALCRSKPVLLEGVPGCGKTVLVQELAYRTWNYDLIRIHVDEQCDSKTLLGNYVCTEIPGEFKWQPGALTQAVTQGLWVVIEDIDLAPFDVLASLIPLLECGELFIPGRGETFKAAEGFQLFATVQTSSTGAHTARHMKNAGLLSNLWNRVIINPLSQDELMSVLTAMYEPVSNVIGRLMSVYQSQVQGAADGSMSHHRVLSTRDIVKLCRRVKDLHGNAIQDKMVTSAVIEDLFRECVDCFCGMIPKRPVLESCMRGIGQVLGLPDDRVEFYVSHFKPDLRSAASTFSVGRVTLDKVSEVDNRQKLSLFAPTKHSVRLLEQLAVCVQMQEPILLIGETGTGKTTVVQHLALQMGQKLVVQNMNQQSESADLLGGFKPVEFKQVCAPLKETFDELFRSSFSKSTESNIKYLAFVHDKFMKKEWAAVLGAIQKAGVKAENKHAQDNAAVSEADGQPKKKKKGAISAEKMRRWKKLCDACKTAEKKLKMLQDNLAFSFVEGCLIQAVRNGEWILLDEINLAGNETLERLNGLLEGERGSITLTERGDVTTIERHPNFRLFACMNPPTDIGKKDLPPGMRNRFTEFYVHEIEDRDDLGKIVHGYLDGVSNSEIPVDNIVDFFLSIKKEASLNLTDGANTRPHYSLRTLSRALSWTRAAVRTYSFQRSLHEGICMSFLTQLDKNSRLIAQKLVAKHIIGKTPKSVLSVLPKQPHGNFVEMFGFWIELGDQPPQDPTHYILVPSVEAHLASVVRGVVSRQSPILLQGPTSSGKTSMVEYVAMRTGHRFVRVNNHEHTDVQEYLGSYRTDATGKLVFQDGILVEAVKKGHWIVLDELNLAPSEVLEALNRLLDDNRELFIPDTQEVIKPHPHFMLFATQNPPGIYGGRKVLSRAFRNRFLELHVDDIPEDEMEIILEKRCGLPPSYSKKLIAIQKDLMRHRQSSRVFAGKHGFITPRDLFRWADRKPQGYEELAVAGYMLLAERLRKDEEKQVVQSVLEKHLKVKLDPSKIYSQEHVAMKYPSFADSMKDVVWTRGMLRMLALVGECLRHKEPVLLVGETGCGKTTVCQIYSDILSQVLHIVNCHQHTETADFLGGLRPMRGRDQLAAEVKEKAIELVEAAVKAGIEVIPGLDDIDRDDAAAVMGVFSASWAAATASSEHEEFVQRHRPAQKDLGRIWGEAQALFLWYDGPLVTAMKRGDLFLIDEISLADDSVMERLNSVMEPNRLLVMAEKGGDTIEEIIAAPDFRIIATMNPGGDFGKKELSPALRNRFTEIWVPALSDRQDLVHIISSRFAAEEMKPYAHHVLDFVEWFRACAGTKVVFSVRDIISWVDFMNHSASFLSLHLSYVHGGLLVLIDGIGINSSISNEVIGRLRAESVQFLINQAPEAERAGLAASVEASSSAAAIDYSRPGYIGVDKFHLALGPIERTKSSYMLTAPTTGRNVVRVLRAMQVSKPILLEGSPGVGKTSLVTALANVAGYRVVRINLSEQTDMSDLVGSDLPVEGGKSGEFRWCDGVLLQAIKRGDWVLLDELNLASQSVLEGLNALLDHRAELFVPELNTVFKCPKSFRVFGAQNPLKEGGGRKGLPKSFLNRFVNVYVDSMTSMDLNFIVSALYPTIDAPSVERMVQFNSSMHHNTMVNVTFGRKGSPWEFNLRDILRWCELLVAYQAEGHWSPDQFVDLLYTRRMRTHGDREGVRKVFRSVFGYDLPVHSRREFIVTEEFLQVGDVIVPRNTDVQEHNTGESALLLHTQTDTAQFILRCVAMRWMCILNGASGLGKTSVVRSLARLTGHTLHEYAMSSSADATELLGCFEQVDMKRHWKDILDHAERHAHSLTECIVMGLCESLSSDDRTLMEACLGDMQHIHRDVSAVAARVSDDNVAEADPESFSKVRALLASLTEVCNKVQNAESLRGGIDDLMRKVDKLQAVGENGTIGSFEWMDGLLIKALQDGDWVLIDNANFCNPTVLDRLNSLLEPNGVLLVNEGGLVDGEHRIVKAHPNFRLFLVLDPQYGELSRAMRNRGIEVSMLDSDQDESNDIKVMLAAAGIRLPRLASAMLDFHKWIVSLSPGGPVLRHLLDWAGLIRTQVERGFPLGEAIVVGLHQVYMSIPAVLDKSEDIGGQFSRIFESLMTDVQGDRPVSMSPNVEDYVRSSMSARGSLHSQILRQIVRRNLEEQLEEAVRANLSNTSFRKIDITGHSVNIIRSMWFNGSSISEESDQDLAMIHLKGRFAGVFFVENVSVYDVDLRRQVLLDLRMEIKNESGTNVMLGEIERLLSLFDFVFSEQNLAALRSLQDVVSDALGMPRSFLHQNPVDLWACNTDLLKVLRTRSLQLQRGVEALANLEAKVGLVQLELLRGELSFTARHVHEAAQTTHPSDMTLVQQSYALYHRLVEQNTFRDEARVSLINPLMEAFDAFIISEMSRCASPNSFEALFTLERARQRLWKGLNAVKGIDETVLQHWHWAQKVLKTHGVPADNILVDYATRFGAAIHADLLQKKNRLWKMIRPRFVQDPVLAKTEKDLLLMDLQMDPNTEETTAHFIDKESRVMMAHALASIFLADFGVEMDMGPKVDMFVKELSKRQAEFVEKVRAKKRAAELLEEGRLNAEEADDTYLLSLMTNEEKGEDTREDSGLWPMYDHFSVMAEWGVLCDLMRSQPDDEDAWTSSLERMLSFSLDYGSRRPSDFLGYQLLLWMDKDSLPSLWHGLMCRVTNSFHKRLWDNSFNTLSASMIDASERRDEKAAESDVSTGPSRLFQCIQTAFATKIICGWNMVSIGRYTAKLKELEGITRHLVRLIPTDVSRRDVIYAFDAFLQVITALQKTFDDDVYHRLVGALNEVRSSIVGLSGPISAETCRAVVDLTSMSSDVRLRELLGLLLEPILVALQSTLTSNNALPAIVGRLWTAAGLVRLHLMAPCAPVDPVAKYSLKMSLLKERQAELSCEIDVRVAIERLITGDSRNERILRLEHDRREDEAQMASLNKRVVPRPAQSQFETLYNEIQRFTDSLGSVTRVQQLMHSLASNSDAAVKEEILYQDSAERFINQLDRYDQYQDITAAVSSCVYQMKYGVRVFAAHVRGSQDEIQKNLHDHLVEIVRMLLEFPSISCSSAESIKAAVGHILDSNTWQGLQRFDMPKRSINMVRSSLFKVCLLSILVMVNESGEIDANTIATMSSVFAAFVQTWEKQEDERRERERLENETFKMKAKNFEVKTDEQVNEEELKEAFPDYSEDFADLMIHHKDPNREAISTAIHKQREENEAGKAAPSLEDQQTVLDDESVLLLTNIFAMVFERVRTGKSRLTLEKMYDRLLEERYSAGTYLLEALRYNCSNNLDNSSVDLHMIMARRGSQALATPTKSLVPMHETDGVSQSYDIHKSPNIREVLLAKSPLLNLGKRLQELLAEWPDHPILLQLNRLVERILGFGVSSPLMKVLVGLEMVLQKAQSWEEYAAKHVTLADHLKEISALVNRWRKYELEGWTLILDAKRRSYENAASKWWFHLYKTVHTLDIKRDNVETEEEMEKAMDEIFVSFDEFVTTSNYGEIRTRLGMLRSFSDEQLSSARIAQELSNDAKSKIRNIMHHLSRYYGQYIPRMEAAVVKDIAPIESKLKDFIKISRWDDWNYYALKSTTDKSHKQLNKFANEFDELLRQSFLKLVDETDGDTSPSSAEVKAPEKDSKPVRKKAIRRSKYRARVYDTASNAFKSEVDVGGETSLSEDYFRAPVDTTVSRVSLGDERLGGRKLQSLPVKIQQHSSKSFMSNEEQEGMTDAADMLNFVSQNIVERMLDLKADTKVKKNVKKNAVNDLLKKLKSFGLSYSIKERTWTQMHLSRLFEEPVANVDAKLLQSTPVAGPFAHMWNEADERYYWCVRRLRKMRNWALQASRDLSRREVEKASGFAEHMFALILDERRSLTKGFDEFVAVSSHFNLYKELFASGSIVNQNMHVSLQKEMELLLKAKRLSMDLKLYLGVISSPEGDETMNSLRVETDMCINDLSLRCSQLSDHLQAYRCGQGDESVFVVESSATEGEKNIVTLQGLSKLIEALETVKGDSEGALRMFNVFGPQFSEIVQASYSTKGRAPESTQRFTDEEIAAASGVVDDAVSSILICVQNLCAEHQAFKTGEFVSKVEKDDLSEEEEQEEDKDETEAVQKNEDDDEFDDIDDTDMILRYSKLYQSLLKAMTSSNMSSKLSRVNALLRSSILPALETTQGDQAAKILTLCGHVYRILSHVQRIYEYVVYNTLEWHRELCKMHYVVTGTFMVLFKEGFCTPPSDSDAKKKSDEFDDNVEGTGMGEGEGKKDVSDQIEDEEQLLGLKDEEKHEKEGDDNDKADKDTGKEMEQDFEGDMKDVDDDQKEDQEEEEEDLDREMHDMKSEDENVVDEKMWGSDEEDEKPEADDKMEKDAPMQGQDQETEMVGKDEEEDGADDDKKDKKEKPQENQDEEQEFPENEEGEGEDEDQVHQQQEEENHGLKPEEQPELDLPDDLNLDDDGKDEGKDEEDGDGDGEDGNEGLPDEMDIDEKENGEDQEGDDNEEGENADQEPEKMPEDADDEGKQQEDEEKKTKDDEGDDEQNTKFDQPEDAPPEEDKLPETEGEKEDQPEASKMEAEAPVGLEEEGADSLMQMTDQQQQGADENQNDDNAMDTAVSAQAEGKTASRPNESAENESKPSSDRKETNPMRKLGDAMEHWKKRLDVKDAEDNHEKEEPLNQQQDNQQEPDAKAEYEFVHGEQTSNAQALAAAEDQQCQRLPEDRPDEDEDMDDLNAGDRGEEKEEKEEKEGDDENKDKDLDAIKPSLKDTKLMNMEDLPEQKQPEGLDPMEEDKLEKDEQEPGINITHEPEPNDGENDDEIIPIDHSVDPGEVRNRVARLLEECKGREFDEKLGHELWNHYVNLTHDLSQELCEQLRLILEPMLATKLQGDYRTGKRINMKKIIPYIASQFRKDKIWLRRTKPHKRQYQIMVAIDDSESMKDNSAGQLACEALVTITKAMTQLEVGDISVVSFGEDVHLLHPFEQPFTDHAGTKVVSDFRFEQKNTNMSHFLETALTILADARNMSASQNEQFQLVFVISDGRVRDSKELLRRWIHAAMTQHVLLVFIIIDDPQGKSSILDVETISFVGGKPSRKPYLDDFPFPYYLILRNMRSLPETLADAMRQWFELLQRSQ